MNELESADFDTDVVLATTEDLSRSNIDLAAGLQVMPGESIPEDFSWEWLPDAARRSGTCLVFVSAKRGSVSVPVLAIAPPFPLQSGGNATDFNAIRDVVNPTACVVVVDLHHGKSRIGIARDARLRVSRTVSRYVRGRHRAGGQSANRFRRNREEWQQKFYDKLTSEVIRLQSESEHKPEWLAIAGDQTTARRWLADTDLLSRADIKSLPRTFDSRGDGRDALAKLAREVWTSRVYEAPPALT